MLRHAHAQTKPGKLRRIGFLSQAARPAALESDALSGFPRGMRDLGYVEGRDYVIEWRFAEGRPENFATAAAELAKVNVDIIVAATGVGIEAARKATPTTPIIMVAMADPVRAGFVASLARPGGNITGLSNQSMDIVTKHPELLRAAIPGLFGVAVLVDPHQATGPIFLKQIQSSATAIGMKVTPVEARTPAEIEAAFNVLARDHARALIVTPHSLFSAQARRIAELAAKDRIPTMFWTREHVEAGGLMSYGQDNAEHYYRAATYVDKIFKGAKPGDLPVELATKIELVINLRTAKTIGLTIPRDLLFRADKVIE
ncbi:MAG TPA: ABC transporter substrate-binding protein [Burkholderiales bacterium]|nr:ABC transporter substrate-binding protein [Burkholderiales bacterium]